MAHLDRWLESIAHLSAGSPKSPEEAIATLARLAEVGSLFPSFTRGSAGSDVREVKVPALTSAGEREDRRLRLAEVRYQSLVEQLPAITFLASLAGGANEIYVSPQIESLLGFTQQQWVSDPILWYRQVHPDDRQRLSQEFAASCLSGQPFRGVVRVYTRTGELRSVHCEARFVRDEEGRLLFLQGVGFDVTEQHRAEQTRQQLLNEQAARADADRQHARLREMFSSLPAMVAVLRGPTHVIEYLNPAALKAMPAAAELLGRPYAEAAPGSTLLLRLDSVFTTAEPYVSTELPISSPLLPAEVQLNLACQPLRDRSGAVEALLVHAVDVTEQVQARKQVEAALQLREEFLSIAAHELRNPINGVKLALQVLLFAARESPGALPREQVLGRLEKADRQINRLARLTENLLDVSRITAGRMELEIEPVDLAAVVRDMLERAAAEIAGRQVTVKAPRAVVGEWDRMRLEQIVANLLGNALKYGEGKPVEISVDEAGGSARLVVRDHGIGLTPENQRRIFDKFERAASLRRYGGLGLGLWITRQIVEALGGRIRVESRLGEGAKFIVMLPTHRDSAPPPAREVLLVEDDGDARDSLAFFLESQGYAVTTAENGRDALDKLEEGFRPALILLDLMMPVMDGWEFRGRQLGDSDLRPIPVIVVSAVPVDPQGPIGPVGFVRKPVDLATLVREVEARLGKPGPSGAGEQGSSSPQP